MTDDFLQASLEQMIDLRQPVAVLAWWIPWAQLEAALAPAFPGNPYEWSSAPRPTGADDDLARAARSRAQGGTGRPGLSGGRCRQLQRGTRSPRQMPLTQSYPTPVAFRHTSDLAAYQEKFEYDLYYLSHRSLQLDLEIIARTVFTMLFKRSG